MLVLAASSLSLGYAPGLYAVSQSRPAVRMSFDQEAFIAESKEMRLKHLEEQAMFALKTSCENFDNAVFPNAMIAGDCVITDLLGRLGYLGPDGKCKIMVVDTFHLFDETLPFLKTLEAKYGFQAEVFTAEGVELFNKEAYDKKYGADLWKEDIEQYDKVCKVEPFQRGARAARPPVHFFVAFFLDRCRPRAARRALVDGVIAGGAHVC